MGWGCGDLAIYHFHVDVVCRSSGRSSVAAAAYRSAEKLRSFDPVSSAAYLSGEKLRNEQSGKVHDYTRKTGVVHSEILLPKHAPKEYLDRETLWNAVEHAEKQYNARTARDIDIALPVEFDRQEQIEIAREYVQQSFVDKGICADFAIHDKGDGNPHAHVMLTTRPINKDGTWGAKSKKEYILDKDGERIKLKSGEWKSRKVNATDWDKTETLIKWRENWADICNAKLREKGLDVRIDHRTLKAQGIDREPQIHVGVSAKNMERRGLESKRTKQNREIIARNTAKHIHKLKQAHFTLEKEICSLQQQTAEARREELALRFKAEQMDERAEQVKTMQGRQYEQAASYFKRNYGIAPEQAGAEVMRLETTAQSKKHFQEKLQGKLVPLVEEKQKIQEILKDMNPEKSVIKDLTDLRERERLRERLRERETFRYR
jgi:hypothetical protein